MIKNLCIVTLLFFSCSIVSVYGQEMKINNELSSVKKLIDLTIAIGLQGYLTHGYKLSSRLQKLIKDSNLGEVMVLISNKVWFGINSLEGTINVLLKDEWITPFTMGFSSENKLPKIEFKNGEIGLRKGEVYVKEGTEAKIENITYKFIKGEWQESK